MEMVKKERNFGIDLFKTVAMFMVVTLHVLGAGAVLDRASGINYWVAWLMECAAYCAVNCFALATGYLMVGRPFRYRKIVPMWLTVTFYSVLLTAVGFILDRDLSGLRLLQSFFPVSSDVYWYFSSYFCLFLFIPFLNFLVENLPEKRFRVLLWTGFLLFSFMDITGLEKIDRFEIGDGYSPFWLMYLYLLGAGIKKYGIFMGKNVRGGVALLGYAAAVVFTLLSKMVMEIVMGKEIPAFTALFSIYGPERFVSYVSPTVVISAVCLMVFCLKVKVPRWLGAVLKWMSPLLFQVYLIHVHPTVWGLLDDRFGFIAGYPLPVMVLLVLGTTVAIFVGCLMIDWVRQQLFRLIRVDRWVDKLADRAKEGVTNG